MTATHGVGTYGNAVGVTTPLDMKMAQLGPIVKTAANTIRAGLYWDGNATVVSGKTNMSYDVRAYTCVTSRGATSGAVPGANDAVLNVATTAAPGSNSRYDVVYHWQREYSIDGTDSNPVIGVIQGAAAASPSVPALTAFPGAIELARILVPAGVTATNSGTTITQTAPFTAAAGGVVVARTTTERDVYVPASTDLTAQCLALADGVTYRWNGSGWKGWESDWISYTPTFTNLTLGNGTLTARYKFVAGRVFVDASLILGSTTSLNASPPTFTHPVTADTPSSTAWTPLGQVVCLQTGVNAYEGAVIATSTTTANWQVPVVSATYASYLGVTSTIPISWASTYQLRWSYSYGQA